ncbi:MAG TPA: SDR family oxidoreductase [Gammaproteobacteria bacterium]|nr:SDR family oxidoreductase [Gammaproteobacteria bacterium]
MVDRVKDKIAVITGAGTGIGRACMTLFAREGATVVGVSRTQKNLDEALVEVHALGGRGTVLAKDLSKPESSDEIVAATLAAYGRIDILVHSASVGWSWNEKSPGSMHPLDDTTPEKWREVIGLNLDAAAFINRASLRQMLKQGRGSIVNVASISGLFGMPTAHTYCAAKGGVINLTRAMATTYAKDGVRTNCVCPGYTDTPMIQSVMGVFDDPAVAAQLTPMARAGTPEEMANGCLFLASDEASYCNGTILIIDGGTAARQ